MIQKRTCAHCGNPFPAKHPSAKYCHPVCRKRAQRARAGEPAKVAVIAAGGTETDQAPDPEPEPLLRDRGLVDAVRKQLEEQHLLDSIGGQTALVLARRLSGYETGSAAAALSRELRAVLTELMGDIPVPGDVVDELKARRDAKLAAGG